jgi:magnesium transporter
MARPTLPRPRIRRGRAHIAGEAAARPEPRILEQRANGLTWVHVDEPTSEEAALLADRFGFHELDIEDVLSNRQRPKIDDYPAYLFVVLHFPFYDKSVQRLNAAELDIFLGPDYLITIPNVELRPVTYLFRRCQEDPELRADYFSKGSGYLLYQVLDDLFDYCFPILDKIAHKLDRIEDQMFEGRSDEVVRDISNVKQEIIAYRKIIKPERATLRGDDIVGSAERIWDLLDNYKEVVEGLESTNEAVIAHRQNYRLQLLTAVSVVLLPLTLIASIFGMNVAFPGFATREAFWVVVGFICALGLSLLAVFRWRRWF